MQIEYTERGFSFVSFVDLYGKKSSLQKSSLATQDAVWLGTDDEDGCRMHLTQEMVRELLPHLQAFVETGEIETP